MDASQDLSNHRVRRVDLATGATTTLAGSGAAGFRDGDRASARFNSPNGVAIDPSGAFAVVSVCLPLLELQTVSIPPLPSHVA